MSGCGDGGGSGGLLKEGRRRKGEVRFCWLDAPVLSFDVFVSFLFCFFLLLKVVLACRLLSFFSFLFFSRAVPLSTSPRCRSKMFCLAWRHLIVGTLWIRECRETRG